MYSKYVAGKGLNIYGKRLIRIPTPQYIVFYNGTEKHEPVEKLHLSDAFMTPVNDGDFKWTATVYNLNRGKDDSLLAKCRPLSDYMELMNRIRDNLKMGQQAEEAVDNAVESCIRDGIMAEFLKSHRAEVKNMCITEYDEEVFVNGIRAEGREEGFAEGQLNTFYALVEDGSLESGTAARKLSITEGEFLSKMESAGYRVPVASV